MKLKPCPFCGSSAEENVFADQANNKKYISILCSNDDCPTDEIFITDMQKGEESDLDWSDCITRWNTRYVLPPTSKENCNKILAEYNEEDRLDILMFLAEDLDYLVGGKSPEKQQYFLPNKENWLDNQDK